jgi:hypothetical protein
VFSIAKERKRERETKLSSVGQSDIETQSGNLLTAQPKTSEEIEVVVLRFNAKVRPFQKWQHIPEHELDEIQCFLHFLM